MTKLISSEKRWIITAVLLAGLVGGSLLFTSFIRTADDAFSLCSTANAKSRAIAAASDYSATPIQLQAIVHYATSRITPQQNMAEISISFNVLKKLAPANFLVFGLGFDSLMWASLNPRGKTLFLEEDQEWFQKVTKDSPFLRAHHVRYRTQLKQADSLLRSYKSEPNCFPSKAYLKGNDRCKLALTGLPSEFYDTEWDLIMLDAPKGYFPEAPGRMAAIFSAAVMARNRKKPGVTHVFLHDVNRRVEKTFAEEFLCRKYRVNAAGRLWHFAIPPVASNATIDGGDYRWFDKCKADCFQWKQAQELEEVFQNSLPLQAHPKITRWRPPPKPWLKCNFGSTWNAELKIPGFAWVLRNYVGTVLLHSRKSFENIHSKMEADLTDLVMTN